MSDKLDKLRATLKELEEELSSVEAFDAETAEMLQEVVREIQVALHSQDPASLRHSSLTDRLGDVTEQFEITHPTLTGILTRIIDGLGQMGI